MGGSREGVNPAGLKLVTVTNRQDFGRLLFIWVISPPAGSLTESYDELGNRYQLPAYTLAPPVNLITETSSESKVSESTQKQAQPPLCRQEFQLRVRLSTGKKHPV